MKEKKLTKARCLRKKTWLCVIAAGVFTTLILIKGSVGLREYIFICIGAIVLTVIYLKMYAFIKELEKKP